ncbi:sulfite exporter TauE/SafE family protein [Oscillospiraceae bacterium MB08-C2-2]|nr:sulfite exporter TauE/SafE family protein [Oscillospiraceae bacterium MB08-C2-2]
MSGWIWIFVVSFIGAVLSSLGMGGGGILLIYLTAYAGVNQLTAQGINLVFFFPIAAVAIFLHARNHLIRWRLVLPIVLTGLVGVWGGALLAQKIGSQLLSKAFACLLLVIGLRELFGKSQQKEE